MLISWIFSGWDIKKGQFQFSVIFLAVFFLVCELYNSGLYILTFFENGQCFYLKVFSI